MDPATEVLFAQVITQATKTYMQYQAGAITPEQAIALFQAASDHLGDAIDRFNRAAGVTPAG